MKQVFYKGLLALTIAFGFTSCDKNDVGDSNLQLTAADAKDNNFIHKVSFGENGLFAPIKGQSDAASKNAAEFASSHIYAETPQMLVISKGTGDDKVVAYSGSYAAGDISSLNPADIILGNGSYSAVSTNDSSADESIVTGFASYSSMVDFDLSESGSIALAVTHDRGFVIADSQRAIEGTRITSVVLSSGELSGNLILDESDSLNDFYGYLIAGTYDVVINYTLDGAEASKSGSVVIANGVASTLLPVLTAETPEPTVTSVTTSEVATSTEANIPDGDVYVNNDDDLIDIVSRTVSSTIVTTGDIPAAATFEYSPWMLLMDKHDVTPGEDSGLGDGSDTTAPVITLASDLPADGGLIATDYTFTITSDDADAVIVWSKNNVVVSGESGLTYTTQFGNANGDKVISVSVTDAADNAASESLTFTVSEPAVDGVDSWEDNGETIGGDETFTNDGDASLEYRYLEGAWGTEAAAQAAADAAITAAGSTTVVISVRSVQGQLRQVSAVIQPEIFVVRGDQDGDDANNDERSTQIVTAATIDGVAADAITASADASYIVVNAPAADVDVTWTDSTVTGKTSYVGSDTDYNFAVEGALADVIVSGIDFPEAISIVVPAYIGGVAFPGVSDTTYTLQSDQELVLAAPIADVVALIQAAINQ